MTRLLAEPLLQWRERAVVADRDGAEGPGDRAEVPFEEPGPLGGGKAAEDQDGQIADMGQHHDVGQGGVQRPHTANGTVLRRGPTPRWSTTGWPRCLSSAVLWSPNG